ncbi:beta-fructofuranosidase, soluble isoenzyme I isoform X2 [Beta vulgaris subsp. vulgaris]|uniref:beta-fructofuranosidase, soluble isoenzyme I isoform X2 n=1 Tax=Beta vulgaris subsp. vulgaris TaxID=3555 RepID=UPI0025492BFD|nr:beta-fructofuranosidase, soluble isoenzyme I isoform X2 [Beta vulgaris subsp. vulgaris]
MASYFSPFADLENNEPLLRAHNDPVSAQPEPESPTQRPIKGIAILSLSFMLILSLMAIIYNGQPALLPVSLSSENTETASSEKVGPAVVSRGKKEGVSEKISRVGESGISFAWTNDMLRWQRSGFHFQPEKNWMNGPLYYKGFYHLFYQYNPDSAVWGNITWGHAISTDLIHWKYLPISMKPDQWYDINGVWTGSATILPDGKIMMVYTGDTDKFVQVQNLAYPANLSDPLLLDWVKYPGNPVLTPPEGIGAKDFRDPTTAWVGPDGIWRLIIGSKTGTTGISLVYKTKDFKTYELESNLHAVPGTGMWECVDFYPVSITGQNGLDTSAYGSGMKHLLKASLDDNKQDHYALGTYDMTTQTWTPDNPDMDVGLGLRLDYGKYYASKTFFDQNKQRRILWGWVGETDTEADDLLKGWASLQTIPRVVTYDAKTGTNILQWPVKEVESLRTDSREYDNLLLQPGSIINLDITSGAQLDISAEFVVDQEALKSTVGDDVINNCSAAAVRQALGPFGLLVLADESLSELTPIYFYIAKASDGTVKNWFCTDQSRSSKASSVDKQIYGGPVPVLEGEKYSMRLLVDHSIIEAFGQGGRTCITSRIYPTKAINGNAKVFIFNNATDSSVTASVKIWELDSINLSPYIF